MFNGLLINPAYAGNQGCLNMNAHVRNQWSGMDGAPTTFVVSAHSPIKPKISLGAVLYADKIGVSRQIGFAGIYSYAINFTNNRRLSIALQGSINNFRNDLSSLTPKMQNDPSIIHADVNEMRMNFGSGFFYSAPRFYAGLSLVNIQANFRDKSVFVFNQRRQYFLNGGYLINLNEDVKLKPNLLVRYIEGSKTYFDINNTVILKEVLWLGVSYRTSGSMVFLTQFKLSDQLNLGYAFERNISMDKNLNRSSHEIMINFRCEYSNSSITPRYVTKWQ
jgi:type IX secretion system PorP/SprF family membrane protein